MLSNVRLFVTPRTVAHQAPLPTGFSRQEHWSGWPCPSPGVFWTQGLNSDLLSCTLSLYPWATREAWSGNNHHKLYLFFFLTAVLVPLNCTSAIPMPMCGVCFIRLWDAALLLLVGSFLWTSWKFISAGMSSSLFSSSSFVGRKNLRLSHSLIWRQSWMVVKCVLPEEGFESCFPEFLTVWLWASCLNSLSFGNRICKRNAEHRRTDAFELWCWRRCSRVPWTMRRSNQSILKEISPEYSLEGPMLKLKL